MSDYTDARPEGADARKEARLTAGTLSLQAHDPTTNLDFRNLKIASLAEALDFVAGVAECIPACGRTQAQNKNWGTSRCTRKITRTPAT